MRFGSRNRRPASSPRPANARRTCPTERKVSWSRPSTSRPPPACWLRGTRPSATKNEPASVLVGIEFIGPGPDHDQRAERVQTIHRPSLRRKDVREPAVDLGTLVQAATTQDHTLLPHPLFH